MVLPITLYTGGGPWNASLEVHALYAKEYEECSPRLRYWVVDPCRLEVAEGSENLIELLALVVRSASEAELLGGAQRLQRLLAALGNQPMEESFFGLVLAQCEKKWPEENWEDCANMAELVDALEEREKTWPEKWKERYIAEGREETSHAMLLSLQRAVRARFGESVAEAFGQRVEIARQAHGARGLEVMDAICRCVVLSADAEQLLDEVQAIRLESA